jgi:23S rRNA U2552 (ribose-2'-O)-methylase RlmE/FtsJ
MLRLFRHKMVFVVKWFQGSHFSEKYFSPKAFFGVWRVRKITNIFSIFIQSH